MLVEHYLDLLRYYRRLVGFILVGVIGGVALLGTAFLHLLPVYTAEARVSILPTASELAFTQNFVQSSQFAPANVFSQTHIENLISRQVAERTIDRLAAEFGAPQPAARGGLAGLLRWGAGTLRRQLRTAYNVLNSGKHVPLDPRTDAVLTLMDNVAVDMVEGTYVLRVAVSLWSWRSTHSPTR